MRHIRGRFFAIRRLSAVLVVTGITIGGFFILFPARASGPFTIAPSIGSYNGGDSITITGSGFATTTQSYDFRSYAGSDDLVIQLDAIQNRRNVPLGAGTTMSGNIAAGTTAKATDTGYFWQDLACTGWIYPNGAASKGIDANCYDWIPKYSTNNQPTVVASGTGSAIHLNNVANGNATTGPAAGFQISGNFNLATYMSATSGANSKIQIETYHRANIVRTGTAYKATIFEYGTADTTNPGLRFFRYASAVNTANLTQCFSNQGSGQKNYTVNPCANNVNWRADSLQFNRATTSGNGYTNTFYSNGASVGTSATGTTAFTPAASNSWFIGARSMTTTNGTANLGTVRYDGEYRALRLYRRALTAQEVYCNYKVDQYRYEGVAISPSDAAACATGAANITGTGITAYTDISPAPTVTIGGKICNVTAYSDTSITCTTPDNAIGKYDVVVAPDTTTGLPSQTYIEGFEYLGDTFEYEIESTGTGPYTYRINPDTLRVLLPYDHAALITISYPRAASDGSTTVMTNSVTMANSTSRTNTGGHCGGVACTTTAISIIGSAANIDGSNGLISFLKSLQWSGGAGFLRGDINISIVQDNVEFWIDGSGDRHFYRIDDMGNGAASAFSWNQAYNYASKQTFHGLTGYLASMADTNEALLVQQFIQSNTFNNGSQQSVAWTAGIRALVANDTGNPNNGNVTTGGSVVTTCNNNMANCSRLDGSIAYNPTDPSQNGQGAYMIPEVPAAASGSVGARYQPAVNGFYCSEIGSSGTLRWCSEWVPRNGTSSTNGTCNNWNNNQMTLDVAWYWATPVDDPMDTFWVGRAGGSNSSAECVNNPINSSKGFVTGGGAGTTGWTADQPQGYEPSMAFDASARWHDYGNASLAADPQYSIRYAVIEFSEGWDDRGGGLYDADAATNWSAPIPLSVTIHHVRANTNEPLAPDTLAPSIGLNTTTGQLQCNAANGGQTLTGYVWSASSCINGLFSYNPANTTQEITYIYTHQAIPDPIPFRMQRTVVGSNYVYTMYSGDAGTAISDFGPIRQLVITYPSSLAFSSSPPAGWSATPSTGSITFSIPNSATPTEVQDYLYTISLEASGFTNTTGSVTVQIADFANTPASGDPGRTSTSAVLPQPIVAHHYRLGQTTDLIPPTETIGLANTTYTVAAPPQYLPLGTTVGTAVHEFYQSSPSIDYAMTYSGTLQNIYYYYQPTSGYTVTFSMNGETAVSNTSNQTVPYGNPAIMPPENPIVLGKSFAGWYTTNSCSTAFDFENTPITDDITIYACFGTESTMTVVFNTISAAGTPVVDVSPSQITNIIYHDFITAPAQPTLPGYAFSGWNTAPMSDATTCAGTAWDFVNNRVELETNTATGDHQLTLYVCWQPRSNVTLNFNTSTNAPAVVQVLPNPASRSVLYNSAATAATSPISEGYIFSSWNTAAMVNSTTCGGSPFDFSTRLTASITTVYACWTKMSNITITFLKGSQDSNPAIVGWPANVTDMPYNSAAAPHEPIVTLNGWRLSHWCLSSTPDCTRANRFDWAARRTSNLTLVAIWREDTMTIDEVILDYGPIAGGNRVTIHGSGFLSYDARSYAQSGLMVLLDATNNVGTLNAPAHSSSAAVWNNLAPSASAAFGNFNLTNATINANDISLNGTNSYIKSASTANLNGTIGGTAISQVTTEMAYRQNAAGSSYTQLYEYGPFGYANTAANGAFGEVINASAASTASLGSCYIGQRTSATAFTGGSGACANNASLTTHSSIQSKVSGVPRRLVVDGNTSSPAVDIANTATTFAATQSTVIGARTTNSGQTVFANHSNISVSSFRMYNRALTDIEILCNYYVDLARFQGIFDPGLSSCASQLVPVAPSAITFGGLNCTSPIITSDSIMSCIVPASQLSGLGEGSVDVYVSINGKNATLVDGYTYRAPLAIHTVSPPSGSVNGGTEITITGHNFVSPNGMPSLSLPLVVTLDAGGSPTNCTISDVTNDTITCTTTAHDIGLVSVTVNNSVEIGVMEAAADPIEVDKPMLDNSGRSIGGFLYEEDIFISIDVSSDRVNLELDSSTSFDQDYMTVGVTTNNPIGYTLSIKSGGINLICEDSSGLTIPSTIGGTIDPGSWGFQVGLSTTANGWAAAPLSTTVIASSNSPTFNPLSLPAPANTRVNFAVREGQSAFITSCTQYSQTIIYTVMAN